jgi:catechol 2,3-dioxygenase-like lactoylglutathione lyase family enzyme
VTATLDSVHPVLMVRDVAATIAFYQRLGFSLAFQDDPTAPRYAGVKRDAVELHLQWHDQSHWDCPHDRPNYRFFVADVDALYLELSRTGVLDEWSGTGPWRAPANTPWGTREFHLRDPSGNGLQFYRRSEPPAR